MRFAPLADWNNFYVIAGSSAGGLTGLTFVVIASNIRHNLGNYLPVREDWIWNVIMPGIGYGALLSMAILLWRHPDPNLYGVSAASMLLLFIGIHNAWDIAVWMTLRKHEGTAPEDADDEKNPRDD
jgi:uncharacterized RDD family membrane protein YckC